MGVVHKLKPEVIQFIIDTKQQNPTISCRALTQLVFEKLQVKLSKSSANAIFKENNLSMPIGRRQKNKKRHFNLPVLPVIEGIKAIVPVKEEQKKEEKTEIAEAKNEKILTEEEKRIKEAEEWALKLREEENSRNEENLQAQIKNNENQIAQQKAEQEELQFLMEEAARINTQMDMERFEKEKAEQEAAKKEEEERLIKAAEEEARKAEEIRLAQEAQAKLAEEEAKKAEEERIAREETLKIEQERIARVAEEARQLEEAKKEAERLAQEAQAKAEQERLAKLAEEEAKKAEEEKLAAEAALKKEQEKWAKLAEEEARAKEAASKTVPEAAPVTSGKEPQKADDDLLAQEAALKAEREKWAKLAEAELRSKQQTAPPKQAAPPIKENATPLAFSHAEQNGIFAGIALLKAIDSLVGGSRQINAAICKELGEEPGGYLSFTESLIFKPLVDDNNQPVVKELLGKSCPQERLDNFLNRINSIQNIKLTVAKAALGAFTEARGVSVHFIDGNTVYFDGQLHSQWLTQNIPFDFSAPAHELRKNLNSCFFEGQPLVLFSAPGTDMPSKEFFNLLLNFGSSLKCPNAFTIFGNKLEEVERVSLNSNHRYILIFGLWPWQFQSSRKVKRIGPFETRHIQSINRDLLLAEIEVELLRASLKQSITLKGCAVKTNADEKIRFVILNSDEGKMSVDQLAGLYLNYWPNFEDAFQDFSRKMEVFAYMNNNQKFFTKDNYDQALASPSIELNQIFSNYIKILDFYLRWHFLPSGYAEKDFSYTSECFYKLPLKIIPSLGKTSVQIQAASDFRLAGDLDYLIKRLNERQIHLSDGSRVFFESVFK